MTFSSFLIDYTTQPTLTGFGFINFTTGTSRRSLIALFKYKVPKSTVLNIAWFIFNIDHSKPGTNH